ncbi:uncharacterized protein DDB_G0283697-like [Argopecten irradians]|uniref:uncharacterized protein DDB_G0283697-like n=1 Tax=Argopecten irradians TaxID=31199 RepID=UPI003720720E
MGKIDHFKRTISVDDFCDKDDKQTSITSSYSHVEERRIQIEAGIKEDRKNMDDDITLDTPNPDAGFMFGISNENQSTTDTGTNNLPITEDIEEGESEQQSNISADKGSGKKKKKKRKRERRKIEPECSIGDLAIITEDDNDRREKRKSRKKSKRQRKEISHDLSETNITGDKCDEVTFASPSTDGTSWNRTELKTETYDGRIDSNLILVRPSTEQNHEEGFNKEMPKSSAAEIVTSKPSPRMSTIPSNEQDLNDEKHITNPPETTVALTNISTKEDGIVSEPNMSESITEPDMPKNKRKSRKKKKREHQDEELESASVVMTEEQYTRRRKKKSKKRDIERMDDIGKKGKEMLNCCSDEGVHVVTEHREGALEK